MNIFATDQYASVAAQNLDDKRVIKMILETAQMLSTAHRLCGGYTDEVYKATHINHPCTRWVRESRDNYLWTKSHLEFLLQEYNHRFEKIHATTRLWPYLTQMPGKIPIKIGSRLSFINCTPYPSLPIIKAYRRTMIEKWQTDKYPPKWTNRHQPLWYKDDQDYRIAECIAL